MAVWKYVMFQDKHGRHFPVIFPAEMVHADTASAVQHSYRKSELSIGKQDFDCPQPVSAGEIGLLVFNGVGGYSETLDMVSHPDDKEIMDTYPLVRGFGFENRDARNTFRKD